MAKEFTLNFKFDDQLFLNFSRLFSHYPGTCILHSGGSYDSASHSFICLFPYETLWIQGHALWKDSPLHHPHSQVISCNPWDALREAMPSPHSTSSFPEWIGFFSYELGA